MSSSYDESSDSSNQKTRFLEWGNVIRKILGFLERLRRTETRIHNHGHDIERPKRNYITSSHRSLWVRDRLLGKGSFGSVFLAKSIAPEGLSEIPSEIAVKSSFMADSSTLQFEKRVLSDLALCENVVHCYGDEITETESGEKVYNILLEYCPGGNLFDYIRSKPYGLPELEVRRYTGDIVRGLFFIHSKGYVHGDLKPDNVLLSWDPRETEEEEGFYMAKIADLGLAKKISDKEKVRVKGAFRYRSPELLKDGVLDWPADIWALGCVVLEMLTGEPAWKLGMKKDHLIILIACSQQMPIIPTSLSSMAKDFLDHCLVRKPYRRSTTWVLMNHPFLQL